MPNRYLHELPRWNAPLLPPTGIFLVEDTRTRIEYYFDLPQLLASIGAQVNERTFPTGGTAGSDVGAVTRGTALSDLTSMEILELVFQEPTVLPTYATARLVLSQSAPTVGEVGEVVENVLTSEFQQGDAGALVAQEIRKGSSVVLGTAATRFMQATASVRRALTPITFRAHAAHAAGDAKLVQPAGTADTRPAQIGNANAPQAANTNLESNETSVVGHYPMLWGPVAQLPATTPQARALSGYQLTDAGLNLVLLTGTQHRRFVVLVPPGYRLAAVKDVETNADLLSQYAPTAFPFDDAGGTVHAYTLYAMQQAIAYSSPHHHLLTISQ